MRGGVVGSRTRGECLSLSMPMALILNEEEARHLLSIVEMDRGVNEGIAQAPDDPEDNRTQQEKLQARLELIRTNRLDASIEKKISQLLE